MIMTSLIFSNLGRS